MATISEGKTADVAFIGGWGWRAWMGRFLLEKEKSRGPKHANAAVERWTGLGSP